MVDIKEKEEDLKSMSLGDHLEELRARLILIILGVVVGLIISLFFGRLFITKILISPFNRAMNLPEGTLMLQTIQPAEGFLVFIKVCLFLALLIVSPWIIWQIWAFVSAGLYKREKRYAYTVAPISATLFIIGVIFFLTVIAPLAMAFFIKFNERLSLQSNWTFQSYINMILVLTLIFGIAFQLPIAIVFLVRMGLVPLEKLKKWRKFVIISLVIIAAIATPPDPVSQLALAVPLYALFESSILICWILDKHKKRSGSS